MPANLAWILPATEPDTGLQEATYTQFLSQQFGAFLGKLNLAAPTAELYGDYTTDFLYSGLNFPLALALVPLSAFGAGALYLPTHDLTLAGMVVDPSGTIMKNDLGKAFADGVMALASADLKVKPWGLPGHQKVTFAGSNKDRISLDQDPSNIARLLLNALFPRLGEPGLLLTEIIEAKAPGLLEPVQPLNEESETWAVVYGFEQFVWQPSGDHRRGVGVFFSAGASDGKANPIKNSYALGLVGKGVVPGRPEDKLGIGWSRVKFSDDFVAYLRDTYDLGLVREDAVELYYNAAVTPWLSLSPSLQILSPALNKAIDPKTRDFEDLDTAYILGLRVGVRF